MDLSVQQLKNKFTKDITILKAKVDDIIEKANYKEEQVLQLIQKNKSKTMSAFSAAQENLIIKKQTLKSSVEDFDNSPTKKQAIRRAKHSEKYAAARIRLAHESIMEAELAIIKAINTAIEADELKKNLR